MSSERQSPVHKRDSDKSCEAKRRRAVQRNRRRRHEKIAAKLLSGLLANPAVSLPAGSLLHDHGEAVSMKERLPTLAFQLAERLLRLLDEQYGRTNGP